jgi:hypothetical protein
VSAVVWAGWTISSDRDSHPAGPLATRAADGRSASPDRPENDEKPANPEPDGAPAEGESSGPVEGPAGEAEAGEASQRDAEFRRLVVGTWEDDYQGKRTMTVREDGTATMVVELTGLKASLFASRLEFQMTWTIQEGRLQKRTTGGEPAAKVGLILKTMGDRVDEPILELTEDRLILLDEDGKTRYRWQRVR